MQDHKPDSAVERRRIEESGGQVAVKAGVARVVWTRPRCGAGGSQRAPQARRSFGGSAQSGAAGVVAVDHVPFLAVARSLGTVGFFTTRQGSRKILHNCFSGAF